MAARAMISLRNISFAYPAAPGRAETFSLYIDSLMLADGELAACIGPSGCGKTTLVNLLAGMLTPSAGEVEIDGVRISELSDAERRLFRASRIGLVFQEFELLEYLSALDNILLPFRFEGGPGMREGRRRAAELASRLGVAHTLGAKPRALSQGERQRIGICRAMITKPRLVLCDEPTGNLDPSATESAVDLLISEAKENGATLFMVTHNHGLLRHFERVIDLSHFRCRHNMRSVEGKPG